MAMGYLTKYYHLIILTQIILLACITTPAHAVALGNFDNDFDVDLQDLQNFTSNWLNSPCGNANNWCGGADLNRSGEVDANDFAIFARNWGIGIFKVTGSNKSPVRLALGSQGNLYVTDDKADSVFIYDPNMVLIGQLKGLSKPMGITVDQAGNIYVGNSGRKNIEKYSPTGTKIATVLKNIKVANDFEFDADGNLYVVDSKADLIRVFDTNNNELPSIGAGKLRFPSAIDIADVNDGTGQIVTELYIAGHVAVENDNPDNDNNSIKVYDLQGNFKRSFGPLFSGFMSVKWKGKFARAQSIQLGPDGNLHVLDTVLANVQIIDKNTGLYITHYGIKGTGVGQMDLPLDIIIKDDRKVVVANHRNKRVEVIHTLP